MISLLHLWGQDFASFLTCLTCRRGQLPAPLHTPILLRGGIILASFCLYLQCLVMSDAQDAFSNCPGAARPDLCTANVSTTLQAETFEATTEANPLSASGCNEIQPAASPVRRTALSTACGARARADGPQSHSSACGEVRGIPVIQCTYTTISAFFSNGAKVMMSIVSQARMAQALR